MDFPTLGLIYTETNVFACSKKKGGSKRGAPRDYHLGAGADGIAGCAIDGGGRSGGIAQRAALQLRLRGRAGAAERGKFDAAGGGIDSRDLF